SRRGLEPRSIASALRMTGEGISSVRDSATVRAWVGGLREQWGEEPGDMADRIEVLQRFCAFVGREPDSVIEECSREVEGGKRIRIKKRMRFPPSTSQIGRAHV